MYKLIIASQNKGKIREISDILHDKYEVCDMASVGFTADVEETGTTFEENSYIKAKAVYDFCRLPSLADDSGLIVEALDGAPGVYSARYAGIEHNDEKNIDLLLKNLEGVKNRKAKFVTVATLIDENGNTIVARGETYGEILTERKGTNGFGYDPVFFSYDLNKSFGEATNAEKDEVSHRKRALTALLEKLQNK